MRGIRTIRHVFDTAGRPVKRARTALFGLSLLTLVTTAAACGGDDDSAAAGAIAWGAVSLTAFYVARTSGGWFGFTDQPGLNPSPEAAIAVISESVTIALGLALLVTDLALRER
jgi:hypothetical protein